MDTAVAERRASSRFGHPSIVHIRAVLRPGRPVWLVNLSTGGALVESRRAMRPGGRVFVHLSTERGSIGRAGHVLRCRVASIGGEDGVRYQGAVRFDEHCGALWEELTRTGYGIPARRSQRPFEIGHQLPEEHEPAFALLEGIENDGAW